MNMYTAGELYGDMTEGNVYTREILDPEGDVICYVIETHGPVAGIVKPTEATLALLSHLNR